jgi:hypothetical protein
MYTVGFDAGEKNVDPSFILRIEFHKKVMTESSSNLIKLLFDEFSGIADLHLRDYENGKVEYRVEFKKPECECQKPAFGWNLILFFSDSWQEVKNAEIDFGEKKVKIFPVDGIGTCS